MNEYKATYMGKTVTIGTVPGLFSPARLDAGTAAMLSVAPLQPDMKVIDLGCGCGVVGILAAKICGEANVTLSDVSEDAVTCAYDNALKNEVPGVSIVLSDGFDAVEEAGFDLILTNPPYQSDFKVAKRFIEKGFNRLKPGGRMLMVTKRLDWYKNKFIAIFGGVKVHEVDGYYVFEAERRAVHYALKRSRKDTRRS